MISVKKVSKSFGNIQAVRDISFDLSDKGILGFLGPNGAGKSTTMRMITGYLEPDLGEIYINGVSVEKFPQKTKGFIGYLPETSPVYRDMTVKGFLKFAASIRGVENAKYSIDRVVSICNLQKVINKLVDTLSKGYYQRVCLAQALIHDPPCLVLDEPTDGLDPIQKKGVCELIKEMGKSKSILISTHMLEEVEEYCSHVAIISEGKIVLHGSLADIRKRSKNADSIFLEVLLPYEQQTDLFISKMEKNFNKILKVQGNGTVQYRFFPEKEHLSSCGMDIISQFINSEKIQITEFKLDTGSLDKVFAEVTVSDRIYKKRQLL